MRRYRILFLLLLLSAAVHGQQYVPKYVNTGTDASFRGLSVADRHSTWVSGSKGWVGRSTNGGKDWTFHQLHGYEHCDFRSLYAFDSNTAIIAHAGSPAYVLRTSDGGLSWQEVYKNTDSAAFIDGIDFWNKQEGVLYGDPVDGQMLLLRTHDGGRSWAAVSESPVLPQGTASFAASGTNICCLPHGSVVIATGGMSSRLFYSRNKGKDWQCIPTPMLAGKESSGIFSLICGRDARHWLLAGGDYRNDTLRKANFCYTLNKGKTWLMPVHTTRGYRECLAVQRSRHGHKIKTLFALGPSGIDSSSDEGLNWKALSDEKGFHVVKASRDHQYLFLAGSNGKLAIMKTSL